LSNLILLNIYNYLVVVLDVLVVVFFTDFVSLPVLATVLEFVFVSVLVVLLGSALVVVFCVDVFVTVFFESILESWAKLIEPKSIRATIEAKIFFILCVIFCKANHS
jgi:hypothetical protein